MSYSIDVYRKKLEPTTNIVAFLSFVTFFPQLVAGPIERATNLLPQFYKKRTFDYANAVNGMRQILWGLVKKIVIADNAAKVVADVFSNYENLNGSMLVIGAVFFAFQIYGDFSGYSDIAIGTSRLFGFSLMKNFAFPYFSRDIAEFWRRWHISLSTWFRDYLYIPLGGSKGGTMMKVRNTFAIFIVSGFWHGANWTFMIWGALNAIYFLPLLLAKKNRTNIDVVAKGKYLPSVKEFFQIALTFFLTIIAWVFFRAANISEALHYLQQMFSASLFSMPNYLPTKTILYILLFVLIEWLGRDREYALEYLNMPRFVRWGVYYLLIFAILWFGGEQQEFIYFQF
jgi:D-alanyl-lipoteichoic acid acyltransferase DltB (MBOAT superfamily)